MSFSRSSFFWKSFGLFFISVCMCGPLVAQSVVGALSHSDQKPTAIAVYEGGNRIAVADDNTGEIRIYGGNNDELTAVAHGLSGSIAQMVVDNGTGKLYATCSCAGDSRIAVINLQTGSFLQHISAGLNARLIKDEAGGLVYAVYETTVMRINPTTNQIDTQSGIVADSSTVLAVNSASGELFIATSGQSSLFVVNSSLNVTTVQGFSGPKLGLLANTISNKVYTRFSATAEYGILNRTSGTLMRVSATGDPGAFVFYAAGGKVYGDSGTQGSADILDGTSNALRTLTLLPGFTGLGVNNSTGNVYYAGTSMIAVFNEASSTLRTFPIVNNSGDGTIVNQIAVNQSNGRVYVINDGLHHSDVTVLQDATPNSCAYSLGTSSVNLAAGAGSGQVSVTASPSNDASCVPSVISSASWLTVSLSDLAVASVPYSVSANQSSQQRTATLTVGGQVFSVVQAGVTFQLDVTKSGSGTGTVLSDVSGINCGATCGAAFPSGSSVQLTASPGIGSAFAGWTGAGCSGTGTCTVSMTQARSVVATFNVQQLILTVIKAGPGGGSVSSSPTGINCGATCETSFSYNTDVTLTATPQTGSAFSGWSGAGCSGTGTCVASMTQVREVTATFALQQFTLSIAKSGAGGGTVTGSPGGINCGATCSASLDYGTAVTLQASAQQGSQFSGWSGGGCTGTGSCQVTISQVATVTAAFALQQLTLTVAKAGTGSGTITSSSGGIQCGNTCSASFTYGTSVTLTATASADSLFTGWSNGGCSGTSTCVLSVSQAATVTATFTLPALTVIPSGTGSGTVTSNPAGIQCGPTCSASFSPGTSVTLTAAFTPGSNFGGWSGSGCSGVGTCTVSMTQVRSVFATFTARNDGGGPPGGPISALYVSPGTPSTLYAGPNPGNGIYKSTDSGASWTLRGGLREGSIFSIASDAASPQILYVVAAAQFFKSSDGGASWDQLFYPGGVNLVVADPQTPGTLYGTSSGDSHLRKSTDGGLTWALADSGLGGNTVSTVVINPTAPSILYASTVVGIYKSTDGGASWNSANVGLPFTGSAFSFIAIDPVTPATLYVAQFPYGVYKSTDAAASWNAINSGLPPVSAYAVTALAIDPAAPSTLYAGVFGGGIYKSSNGGQTWSSKIPVGRATHPFYSQNIVVAPDSLHSIYANTEKGLFKSVDGATSWTLANAGITSYSVTSLRMDPSVSGGLFAGTWGSTAFWSPDGGASWQLSLDSGGTLSIDAIGISPGSPEVVHYGLAGGSILSSLDRGRTITNSASFLPNTAVSQIITDPQAPDVAYAATSKGVYKSTNRGSSWTAMNQGLSNLLASGIAIHPTASGTLYVCGYGGVFKTTDGGAQWTAANNGFNSLSQYCRVVIDPQTPTTLYLVTASSAYKSTDSAGTWSAINSGLPTGFHDIVINPATPTTLFVCSDRNSVFKSTNGGAQWSAATSGLPLLSGGGLSCALAIDPSSPSTIYMGTSSHGIFKSTNGGTTWIPTGSSQLFDRKTGGQITSQ